MMKKQKIIGALISLIMTLSLVPTTFAESTANKIGQPHFGVDRFAFQRSFVIRNL